MSKTSDRSCPLCMSPIIWEDPDIKHTPMSKVVCMSAECKWSDVFYNSMPVKPVMNGSAYRTNLINVIHGIMKFEIDTEMAIKAGEDAAMASPYADPYHEGNDDLRRYVHNIGMLIALNSVLSHSGLPNDIISIIMSNETSRLFPNSLAKR